MGYNTIMEMTMNIIEPMEKNKLLHEKQFQFDSLSVNICKVVNNQYPTKLRRGHGVWPKIRAAMPSNSGIDGVSRW